MAAGLPVVASSAGGLAETVPDEGLYPPGDVAALAERVRALYGDAAAAGDAGARARRRGARLYDGRLVWAAALELRRAATAGVDVR